MTEESATAEAQEKESQGNVKEAEQVERQVPLKALEAERKKRQEAELKSQWIEQQYLQAQAQPKQEEPVDEYEQELEQKLERKFEAKLKNQMEQRFLQENPDVHNQIENVLPDLLKKKPWLAQVIQTAPNRYERAMELINDYRPRAEHPNEKRLEENSTKPDMSSGKGKPSNLGQLEQMRNMDRKSFSQWRASMLGRQPNIR